MDGALLYKSVFHNSFVLRDRKHLFVIAIYIYIYIYQHAVGMIGYGKGLEKKLIYLHHTLLSYIISNFGA